MIDQYITRAELSAKLKVHANTLRRWERSGKLTAFGIAGGNVRYSEADVNRVLREISRDMRARPGPNPRQRVAIASAEAVTPFQASKS